MKSKSKKYRDLIVWQKAHQLVKDIYKLTLCFPKEEIYGLASQLRRAAVSIPANIAEGFGRFGSKDKVRFYNFSTSSLNEVDYYLFLAEELEYAQTGHLIDSLDEIGKMLNSYSQNILNNPIRR